MPNQLLMVTYRPEFGDGYAVDAQVAHPYEQGRELKLRFFFDDVEELWFLLLDAHERNILSGEDRYTIADTATAAIERGWCNRSLDEERDIA